MGANYIQKVGLHNILRFLIGESAKFKAEHQFLNMSCLFGIIFYSLFIVVNIVFHIEITLTIVKLTAIALFICIYYFSRFKYVFSWTSFLFFLTVILSFLYLGLKNGGITGGIAPIYIAVLALMLFIIKGAIRYSLVTIWFLCMTSLFLIEYYRPELITPYANTEQKFIDMYLGYITGILIMAFVVVTVTKLYSKERLNFEELVEKYRSNGFELKEIVNVNIKLLTAREKEICGRLVKGCSNKEIANDLFIAPGTVKSHLNRIYKKLGANNRTEVINHLGKL